MEPWFKTKDLGTVIDNYLNFVSISVRLNLIVLVVESNKILDQTGASEKSHARFHQHFVPITEVR